MVGDSTASNSQDLGWGSHLGKYFDAAKVNVLNRARGGRSSRTFQLEGLWDKVLAEMKAGDFVLIQFGHNDGGAPTGTPGRGSLKGLGEETQEITNNSGQQETVHTFGWYMRKYVADTRAKGATPVILSLTVRNEWRDGKVERGPGQYSKWSEEVAKSQGALFVDLNNFVGALYEKLGQEKVKEFFPRDHTHTSADGANLNARSVIAGLKGLSGRPLTGYLSDAGKAVEAHSAEPVKKPDAEQPAGRPERAQQSSTPRVGPVHPGFNAALPTLWIIGDSTVKNGRDDGAGGLWGWGNPIAAGFDKTKINVENQALGGTSSRSFITTKLWDAVLVQIKPGDFVILQFGHNDGGGAYDDSRARKSISGSGGEIVEVTLPGAEQKEVVHTYGWYISKYITDTKAKGAIPIVCSLIPRNDWTGEKVRRASNSYGKWAAEAAKSGGAFFIDLNEIIAARYEQIGREKVTQEFFVSEHTHTSLAGAKFNAERVIDGLKGLSDCPLNRYLLPQ